MSSGPILFILKICYKHYIYFIKRYILTYFFIWDNYQLDRLTPGIIPSDINSLKRIREILNGLTKPIERYKTQIEFIKLNQNSSKTRLKKRCILTGRSKGLVNPFNISRIRLRELISDGMIPGVKRSSW
jgi:small subunit ribosomal protein S14